MSADSEIFLWFNVIVNTLEMIFTIETKNYSHEHD